MPALSKVEGWLGVDPLAHSFQGVSPFNFNMNNPIMMVDPGGDSTMYFVNFSMNTEDARRVADNTRSIFEKNGINGFSYKVISPKAAFELKLLETDAIVSLTKEKGNEYSGAGNTDPYVFRSNQDYESIENTYVNLNSRTFTSRDEKSSALYAIGYVAAHEMLNQLKEKASFHFSGSYNAVESHDNTEMNLNHSGGPHIPRINSKYLRPAESLTKCDSGMIKAWLRIKGVE